jgi:hypothetical protein
MCDLEQERKYVESWEKPNQTLYMAGMMEINKLAAVRIRTRFLEQENDMLLKNGGDVAMYWVTKNLEEIQELARKLRMRKRKPLTSANSDEITPQMIAAARDVPITELVEFVRGKTMAWCHNDKRPSAFHGTKFNIVVCPVCDKKFDTIGVLMKRDGMSFVDAVRSLC